MKPSLHADTCILYIYIYVVTKRKWKEREGIIGSAGSPYCTAKIYVLIIIVTSVLACVRPINAGVRE